jgi:hypothetical protein
MFERVSLGFRDSLAHDNACFMGATVIRQQYRSLALHDAIKLQAGNAATD